jgi:hypothetical protein
MPGMTNPQSKILGSQSNQNPAQASVVLNVFNTFLAGNLIERRLRNINLYMLKQLWHMTIEKFQQQHTDMRNIHNRVTHNNDLKISHLADIK